MVTNYQRIYEKLGFLFYAIAVADNVVTNAEMDSLKEMVQKIWVPAEDSTDEFGTDAAQYIFISFDYLVNEGVGAETAFVEFEDYYSEHSAAFDKEMKKNILSTAHGIAEAFKGENSKESAILARLESLLE